jgi:hypothetical protein
VSFITRSQLVASAVGYLFIAGLHCFLWQPSTRGKVEFDQLDIVSTAVVPDDGGTSLIIGGYSGSMVLYTLPTVLPYTSVQKLNGFR